MTADTPKRHKAWYKRWWAWVIYVIVALIVIGNIGAALTDDDDDDKSAPSTTASATSSTPPKSSPKATPKPSLRPTHKATHKPKPSETSTPAKPSKRKPVKSKSPEPSKTSKPKPSKSKTPEEQRMEILKATQKDLDVWFDGCDWQDEYVGDAYAMGACEEGPIAVVVGPGDSSVQSVIDEIGEGQYAGGYVIHDGVALWSPDKGKVNRAWDALGAEGTVKDF